MRHTKIVATVGPASDTPEKIEELLRAGVDVFRFNMKHGNVEWHSERIDRARVAAEKLGRSVGILIDLQGPEIRIETPDQQPIPIGAGEEILLATQFVPDQQMLRVEDPRVLDALEVGHHVLIDDGYLELVVSGKSPDGVMLRSTADATIVHQKGMNLPGIQLDLHALIESDLERLDMGAKENVDFVALSFIRSANDVVLLRREMAARNLNAHVVGKIENAKALENLTEIIETVDAVMVARGDLGIEVPIEQLAYWQKTIIDKCRDAGKPVITATQMLQSMIESPRPTRAEVTDVANAVFDGSDAIMLSGETASGSYPSLAVHTMARIAEYNEQKTKLPRLPLDGKLDLTESITRATMTIVAAERNFEIAALVVSTETGRTVRSLSRFRPKLPIVALTRDPKVRDQLCLSYGVHPLIVDFPAGQEIELEPVMNYLKTQGIVRAGQHILFIHGLRWSEAGKTDTMVIEEVK